MKGRRPAPGPRQEAAPAPPPAGKEAPGGGTTREWSEGKLQGGRKWLSLYYVTCLLLLALAALEMGACGRYAPHLGVPVWTFLLCDAAFYLLYCFAREVVR